MTWKIVLTIVALFALAGLIIRTAYRRRVARRVRRDAESAWRSAGAARQVEAMRARIAIAPDNPVAWFLLGCAQLRANRVKEAARCFGMAYHLDVEIESAALLTFACLKVRDGAGSDILDQLAITWREMREPDLAASAADRHVMEAIAAPSAPVGLSTLGRLAWAVAGQPQRDDLGTRLADRPPDWKAFFN